MPPRPVRSTGLRTNPRLGTSYDDAQAEYNRQDAARFQAQADAIGEVQAPTPTAPVDYEQQRDDIRSRGAKRQADRAASTQRREDIITVENQRANERVEQTRERAAYDSYWANVAADIDTVAANVFQGDPIKKQGLALAATPMTDNDRMLVEANLAVLMHTYHNVNAMGAGPKARAHGDAINNIVELVGKAAQEGQVVGQDAFEVNLDALRDLVQQDSRVFANLFRKGWQTQTRSEFDAVPTVGGKQYVPPKFLLDEAILSMKEANAQRRRELYERGVDVEGVRALGMTGQAAAGARTSSFSTAAAAAKALETIGLSEFHGVADTLQADIDYWNSVAGEADPSFMADVIRGLGGLAADGVLLGAGAKAVKIARAFGVTSEVGLTAIGGSGISTRTAINDGAMAGLVEALVPAMFGMKGIEAIFRAGALPAAEKKVLRTFAKNTLVGASSEAVEEATTELGQAIVSYFNGDDPNALELTSLMRRLAVAGATGAAAGGPMQAAAGSQRGDLKQAIREVPEELGNLAQTAKDIGADVAATAKDVGAGVKAAAKATADVFNKAKAFMQGEAATVKDSVKQKFTEKRKAKADVPPEEVKKEEAFAEKAAEDTASRAAPDSVFDEVPDADLDAAMDAAMDEAFADAADAPADEAGFREDFKQSYREQAAEAEQAFDEAFKAQAEEEAATFASEPEAPADDTLTFEERVMSDLSSRAAEGASAVKGMVREMASRAPGKRDHSNLAKAAVAEAAQSSSVSSRRAQADFADHVEALTNGRQSPLTGRRLATAQRAARTMAAAVEAISSLRAGPQGVDVQVTKPRVARIGAQPKATVDVQGAEVSAPPTPRLPTPPAPKKSAGKKAAPKPKAAAPVNPRLAEAVTQGLGTVVDTSKRVLRKGIDPKTARDADYVMSPGAKRIQTLPWFNDAVKAGIKPEQLQQALDRLAAGKPIASLKAGRWITENQDAILADYADWEAQQEGETQAVEEAPETDYNDMTDDEAFDAGMNDPFAENPFDPESRPAQFKAFEQGQRLGDLPAFAGISLSPTLAKIVKAMSGAVWRGVQAVGRYTSYQFSRMFPNAMNPTPGDVQAVKRQAFKRELHPTLFKVWEGMTGKKHVFRIYQTMIRGKNATLAEPGVVALKRLKRLLSKANLTSDQLASLMQALQGDGTIIRPPDRKFIRSELAKEYRARRDAALAASDKEIVAAVTAEFKKQGQAEIREEQRQATDAIIQQHKFAKAEFRRNPSAPKPMTDQQLGIAKERARNAAKERVLADIRKRAKAEAAKRNKEARTHIKNAAAFGLEQAYGKQVDEELQAMAELQLAQRRLQDAALSVLPETLHETVKELRGIVDALSVQFGELGGLVSEVNAETIEANLGSYMRRAFKFYSNPSYRKLILTLMEKTKTDPTSQMADLGNQIISDVQADYSGRVLRERLAGIPKAQQAEWIKAKVAAFAGPYERATGDKLTADVLLSDEFALPTIAVTRMVMDMMNFGLNQVDKDAASGGTLGQHDLGQLLQRDLSLPESVRQVFGEITDPVASLEKTMLPMAMAISTYQAQASMKADLYAPADAVDTKNAVFFDKDAGNAPIEATAEITAPGPLNGLMTYPEVAAELTSKKTSRSLWHMLVRSWGWMNARASQALTQGSELVFARNVVGAMLMAAKGGYLLTPSHVKGFYRAIKEASLLVKDPNATGGDLMRMAREENIVMEDFIGAYLKTTKADSAAPTTALEEAAERVLRRPQKALRAVKSAGKIAGRGVDWAASRWSNMYNLLDAAAKIHALKVEYDRGIAKGMEPINAQRRAGAKVRAEWPNFADEYGIVQNLRTVPAIGFLAFWNFSMLRTSINTSSNIVRDLRDPQWRKEGAVRLATETAGRSLSILTNGTIGVSIITAVLAAFSGDDPEELKGMTAALQTPYDNGSRIPVGGEYYTATYEDGTTERRYVVKSTNLSTTNPTFTIDNLAYGSVAGIFNFIRRNTGLAEEEATLAANQVFDIIKGLGAAPTTQLVAELMVNTDQYRRPIMNEYDGMWGKLFSALEHAGGAYVPGVVSTAYKTFYAKEDGEVNRYGIRNNRDNYIFRYLALSLSETDYGELTAYAVRSAVYNLRSIENDSKATPEQILARKQVVIAQLNKLASGLDYWRSRFDEGEGDRLIRTSLARAKGGQQARALLEGLFSDGVFTMPGEKSSGAKVLTKEQAKKQMEKELALDALRIGEEVLGSISRSAGDYLKANTAEGMPEEARRAIRVLGTAEALKKHVQAKDLNPFTIERYLDAQNVGPQSSRGDLALEIYRAMRQ